MIKSKLQKVVLGTAILTTSLLADTSSYSYDIDSLVGFEVGYASTVSESVDSAPATPVYSQNTAGLYNYGVKLGAQTKDYRLFLSARNYADPDSKYSNVFTYGAELQYKFNVAKAMDIFIGANTGYANIKYSNGTAPSVSLNKPYFGGDIGANIHMGDAVDLEVGARVMSLEAEAVSGTDSYRLNSITTGYASLIFKWKMD